MTQTEIDALKAAVDALLPLGQNAIGGTAIRSAIHEAIDGLAGGTGPAGDYLPLANPDGETVTFGPAGSLELQDGSFDFSTGQGGTYAYDNAQSSIGGNTISDATFAGLSARRVFGTEQKYGIVQVIHTDTEEFVRLAVAVDENNAVKRVVVYDLKYDGIYKDGVLLEQGGGGSATLYTTRGQQVDGAPTNKLLDDSLKLLEPEITALTINAGAVTVPMYKGNDYTIASQPTTINVNTGTVNVATGAGNKLGAVVLVKFPASGTAEPTVNGATKHIDASRPFKATAGVTAQLRIWCETNVSGAKTNYYIWT